jgi:hypothetical protein
MTQSVDSTKIQPAMRGLREGKLKPIRSCATFLAEEAA